MTPTRRRTRTGLPVAVLIAILTAIFASRTRAPSPAAARDTRVPSAAPSTPATTARGGATNGATNGASTGAASPDGAHRGASPGFASRQRLEEHFEKHGAEFPGLDINGYLLAAQTLRDAAAGGSVLELRRRDGVVTRFDTQSGAFLAVNRDGTIRTFFRPNDGEAYFRRQASRTPGGGP